MKKHLQAKARINHWSNEKTFADKNFTSFLTNYLNDYIDEGEIVSCTGNSVTIKLGENQINFCAWTDICSIIADCPSVMPTTVEEAMLSYKERARLVKVAIQAHMALKWVMDK